MVVPCVLARSGELVTDPIRFVYSRGVYQLIYATGRQHSDVVNGMLRLLRTARSLLLLDRPPSIYVSEQPPDQTPCARVLLRHCAPGVDYALYPLDDGGEDLDPMSVLIYVRLEAWLGLEASPPIQ